MRIGIDWGGTKIEIAALDDRGAEVLRERIASPKAYDEAVAAVARLVESAEKRLGRTATVGIGIPGAISPATGLIKNANSTHLNGHPLDRDIERALGRPVRVENDANCLAVSEAVDGAGAGERIVWAVILGTGVGSGIAVDGRALSGRQRIAGEWGHNPLPWPHDDERPGPPCYCGKHGCIETWLSGPGFAADHLRITKSALTAEEIITAMRAGDAAALASYDRWLDRLARGIAHVVDILDPDIVVLGGGLSNIDELYADLPARLAPCVFSDTVTTPIVKAMHGDSSGVRGAAWLWGPGEGVRETP